MTRYIHILLMYIKITQLKFCNIVRHQAERLKTEN